MRVFKFLAVLALFAVISIPGAANAQTQRAGTFTISPMIGGFYWDPDEHVGNGPEYGIGVGYNFTDHFGTEFMFNFADPGTDNELDNGDINLLLFHLDAVYHFKKLWMFDPYVVAGIGAGELSLWLGHNRPHQYDQIYSLNYGGGIEYFISKKVAIRGDLRHVITLDNHTLSNLMYTAGATFYIVK
jgi:OmpA-OmpF porin, OOP family